MAYILRVLARCSNDAIVARLLWTSLSCKDLISKSNVSIIADNTLGQQ